MPQTRSRGTRASVVKPEVMGQVAGFLGELPDKPKDQLSLKEAIAELSEQIQSAFDKGYTYPEIAEILHDHGIQISAFTLKSYVPRGRKKTSARKTGTTKKTRKPTEGVTTVIQEPAQAPAKAAKPKASETPATTRKPAAKAASTTSTTTRKPTSPTTRKRKTT
ncbi:MAG TPA: hypothetical protein IGS53_07525 [Leptolyngbyaceae cyanobacterium M33_DOE_097]|uniref:Uncharacterized protein n=1 Tax=Oscillatoriales cyanobacterium SpSt-418 TaxID=2282169 RepID=A0A7C3PTT4_9CYAN|nr:hypothetical protein [Leptolyngbyaceae cyanobacterium M33_DOE_097]